MDPFAVTESRLRYFHRVLLDQARRTPALVQRASRALPGLKQRAPALAAVWDDWEGLLAAGLDAVEAATAPDTPQAGLLRAHSPLAEILDMDERNALWQRVGLQQIAAYYLEAVEDLRLSLDEEAAITGMAEDELAGWSDTPPMAMTRGALDALKMVIAIQRALLVLHPDVQDRRAWLRAPCDGLAGSPIDVLVAGGGERVQDHLAQWVRPVLGADSLPSH